MANPPAPRLTYLDHCKGVLVVLMVVYHSLNYTTEYQLAFRFLCFLPLSFILITGFLLSRVYLPRYGQGDGTLRRRLLQRGTRLLLLFTLLNVVAQYVRSPIYGRSVGVEAFFQSWREIFLLGGATTAAFDVLLPIAYLILFAPLLLALSRRSRTSLTVLAILLTIGCCVLEYRGVSIANLNFICVGVGGMAAGQYAFDGSKLGKAVILTGVLYAAYFPLGMFRGWLFPVQLLGAWIALSFICSLSVRASDHGWWNRRLVRLGQYSLVAYIVQIALLQVLTRIVGRPEPISAGFALLFAATLVVMTILIEATAWLRLRSRPIDAVYRSVFA